MTRRQWIGFCVFAVGTAQTAIADSIWARRDPRYAYLFIDTRARRIGDVLTVTVNENTGTNNNEQRKMKKDTAASGKFNFAGKTSGAGGSQDAAATLSADNSSDRTFQGSSQTQSTRTLLDQMEVTVVDILPNGNLVVEGVRYRQILGETRLLRISGVVRPVDIDQANNIPSNNVAAFKIYYEGGGVESRFTNQGWMGRFTNKLWPY